MATAINQTNAVRQSYQPVTVSSCPHHRRSVTAGGTAPSLAGLGLRVSVGTQNPLPPLQQTAKSDLRRGSRGSDPRLLRLTMGGLLDRHIWGATPCIKDRPHHKVRPTRLYAGQLRCGVTRTVQHRSMRAGPFAHYNSAKKSPPLLASSARLSNP